MGDIVQLQTICAVNCGVCGVLFGLEDSFDNARRADGVNFRCPNGHIIGYQNNTDKQQIARLKAEKQQLENQRQLAEEKRIRAENDAKIFREEAFKSTEKNKRLRTAIKKKSLRIKNGLCPHCDRSFENLQRHMVSKHSRCKSAKGYKVKNPKLP